MEYQKWRFTHHLIGIPLFLASLHVYFVPGNLSENHYLRYYLLFITLTSLIIYLTRTVFFRLFIKRYKYRTTSVETRGNEILEIFMVPINKQLKFLPGQFAFIEFIDTPGINQEPHPFSFSTSPKSSSLGFAVKSLGDFTETLKLLRPGSNVLVEGPFGRFISNLSGIGKQIWIAGGIGITPFLSMARSLHQNSGLTIDLYYVVSTSEEAVFEKELFEISNNINGFTIHSVYSKQQRRLTAQIVSQQLTDFKVRDIFLCGPLPMMKDLRNQFRKLGCNNDHIHSEEFALR